LHDTVGDSFAFKACRQLAGGGMVIMEISRVGS
jgi:hypothetical protein